MAIFRIEKTKDYTVMSNHHLRNKNISLKAKGLLSQILSLPTNWDYTLKGLAHINKENVDAIRAAVRELEQAGYIVRGQKRDEKGSFSHNEYVIYELPQSIHEEETSSGMNSKKAQKHKEEKPLLENPTTGSQPLLENPTTGFPIPDNPRTVFPISQNPTQLNKEQRNTDLNIRDLSINPSNKPDVRTREPMDTIDRIETYRQLVEENIEYDFMLDRFDVERLNELIEIMVDAVCTNRKTLWVAGDEIPAEVVRSRLLKIDSSHIEYVFDCLQRNTTKVYNIKSYLLTTLYNATLTMGSYYTAEVNHDLYGK